MTHARAVTKSKVLSHKQRELIHEKLKQLKKKIKKRGRERVRERNK